MKFKNRWVFIVAGLLVAHVSLMSWAVMKATTDRNGTVITDYYNKSTHWDEMKARQAKSDALGWSAELGLTGSRDPLGRHEMKLWLRDGSGTNVKADSVTLSCYHESRPTQVETVKLLAHGDGLYRGYVVLPQRGFYALEVSAKAGQDEFVKKWSQFLQP